MELIESLLRIPFLLIVYKFMMYSFNSTIEHFNNNEYEFARKSIVSMREICRVFLIVIGIIVLIDIIF